MRKRRNIAIGGGLAIAAALAVLAGGPVRAVDGSFANIERGRQLVDAGDCVSCHTVPHGGAKFAGGRPVETPFGLIYAPNITPNVENGIGGWSDEDFYRAMHEGIRPDGKRLYPAFPYPYFTRMTRDDVMAIRAYLNTLPAVNNPPRDNKLIWPLNHRVFMRGWNMLFFRPGTFKPDPEKTAEWNRGAYLVEGPAHCGACHTPKNILGADKKSQAMNGGAIQNWFAPKIASDMHDGIGAWSPEDLVEYLKTGRNKFSGATGLMAEVVSNSTSKMNDADLRAIATYLKDMNGDKNPPPPPPPPQADNNDPKFKAGAAIYADSCSACHAPDGTGVAHMFPPLAHNSNVQQRDPSTVIRVILDGAQTVPTDKRPTNSTMPAYNWKLRDDQVAAVASYVRNAWGNQAPPVDPDQVKDIRDAVRKSRAEGL